jgi:hypothetical protein
LGLRSVLFVDCTVAGEQLPEVLRQLLQHRGIDVVECIALACSKQCSSCIILYEAELQACTKLYQVCQVKHRTIVKHSTAGMQGTCFPDRHPASQQTTAATNNGNNGLVFAIMFLIFMFRSSLGHSARGYVSVLGMVHGASNKCGINWKDVSCFCSGHGASQKVKDLGLEYLQVLFKRTTLTSRQSLGSTPLTRKLLCSLGMEA